jgi:lipopolysaccharide transport system ATP-binding protein
MSDTAIQLRGIGKRFAPRRTLIDRLRPLWGSPSPGAVDAWALRDITLDIPAGSSTGIIGLNGSGKTTLLEIIAGTLAPSTGEVRRQGRVAALLELSSGFHPDLTGTDNVLLNGMVAGLSRSEVERRFDEIARFADIGDVLEQPVKTYSSGMLARLAFALHTVLTPDVFLVDEILAVGDYFFQQKCYRRLAEMREDGVTLLFVSHDLTLVRDLCDHAACLRGGRLAFWGDSAAAVHRLLTDGPSPGGQGSDTGSECGVAPADPVFGDAVWVAPSPAGHGSDRRLAAIRLCAPDGASGPTHLLGSRVKLQAWFRTRPDDQGLTIGLAIKNRYDQTVTSVNSTLLGCEGVSHEGTGLRCFEFEFDLLLEGGQYSLRLGLNRPPALDESGPQPVDGTDWFGPITVAWDYTARQAPFLGMFGLPMTGRWRPTAPIPAPQAAIPEEAA